jgi:DNA-binding MarR family transcriptional regulator
MKREAADHVVRAVLSLARRLRAERPRRSASLSSIGVLSTLNRAGAMPATRLASEERLRPQSLTRIILHLEAAGWITRKRSAHDRREITIALTPRGRRILDGERKTRQAWLERAIAAKLTATERSVLLAAADIMLKLAEIATTVGDSRRASKRAGRSPEARRTA